MTDVLEIANRQLLAPGGLTEGDLDRALGKLLGPAIDSADLYFQHSRHESWVLEDGIVKDGSHSIDQGVGARAISGEKSGFAYSDELVMPALLEAADTARAIARGGQSGQLQAWQRAEAQSLYRPVDPVETMTASDKVALLREVDAYARAQDPRVKQVIVSLGGRQEIVLIAGSDGTLASDVRPMARMLVQVIAEDNGRREQGRSGGGGRYGYDVLTADGAAFAHAREAVRQALVNLEAEDAPAGTMTVVLGPGWPAVLLHEAVGHGLEGDFNRKGLSAFAGRMGERVASELCTVVDDGTLHERRGSLSIDDEGVPAQKTVLIEDGRLRAFMQDKHNARLMGQTPTGNGRRESFAHMPMPRMTNTYMLPGRHEHEEILASVDNGLYAANFGGGQVDITNGKFVFSASEAYLIEHGRITRPVKGAMLIGSGPDVLTRVSMVGNNLQLDEGVGVCGKEGQSVPVGVGQPTIRVDGITVGGTNAE